MLDISFNWLDDSAIVNVIKDFNVLDSLFTLGNLIHNPKKIKNILFKNNQNLRLYNFKKQKKAKNLSFIDFDQKLIENS